MLFLIDGNDKENTNMDRRTFITLIASAVAYYPIAGLAEKRAQFNSSTPLLKEPWKTIAAVQEHLFPADKDSPGASDIQALNYLQNMINAPDIEDSERESIKNGSKWLNDLSIQIYNKNFTELGETNREKVLRRIENSRAGRRWLSLLMTYLIEALLSEPVYGGNKNGIGWKWLEHQPGFPTPSIDKMYFKLGKSAALERSAGSQKSRQAHDAAEKLISYASFHQPTNPSRVKRRTKA